MSATLNDVVELLAENKLAELENKLPGALDSVMSNPLLKPFLKMVSK